MTPFRILILLVAVGAAMGVALLVRSATSAPAVAVSTEVQVETVQEEVQVSEIEVLVANRDLRIGEVLTPEDFRWALWPEDEVNTQFYVKTDGSDTISDLSGRVVRQYIYEKEPLIAQRIVEREEARAFWLRSCPQVCAQYRWKFRRKLHPEALYCPRIAWMLF